MDNEPSSRSRQGRSTGLALAFPPSIYLVIFFVIPLFFVLVMSVLSRGSNPSDYKLPLTYENYTEIFKEPIRSILLRSIWTALLTTFICFVIGYPLAFFISTRQRAWVRNLALFLVILPFWTNFLVRTYAWQIILGRRGVLNEVLIYLDIIKPRDAIEFLGTQEAVLLGLVYGFLPFMVLPIYASVERFNFRLVEAAHDLGANDLRAFLRVVFPLTLPGVVAGWILVFIPAIGAFVTPALLGGTKGFMIGNLITRQFKDAGGSWTLGSGSSVVMMLMVSAALYVYMRYADEDSFFNTSGWMSKFFGTLWQIIKLPFHLLHPPRPSRTLGIVAQPPSVITSNGQFELSRFQIQRDLWIRRIGRFGLWLNPVFCYIFLWIPILLLVIYSFNASRRAGGRWEGFTTDWYKKIFEGVAGTGGSEFSTDQLLDSVQTSVIVSVSATLIATVLGTALALALVRGTFRNKSVVDGLVYLPIVLPDITMGVSMLVFFKILFDLIEAISGTRVFPGMTTVILAHAAFNISFVAIVVRARLTDMNPRLEEAARDLGANEWRTFWRVTYPLLLPGIVAGALLAFTISLDDFVVTFFVGGGTTTTLTIFVWGLVRRGVSPEINAVSTLMIVVSTLLIGLSLLLQGRNASRT